jgi:chemotaxis protein methyltransferase CheR
MTMMETMKSEYDRWRAGLLATDVSAAVIEAAEKGVYSNDRIEQIPEPLRKKYLRPLDDERSQFIPRLRKEIVFRRFNLMNPVFPFKKRFHVVFCRNVMIYFDQPTRKELIKKLFDNIAPGGYLFIGHSESIRYSDCPFEIVKPAVYRKRD